MLKLFKILTEEDDIIDYIIDEKLDVVVFLKD